MLQYRWNIGIVDVKHQQINQSIKKNIMELFM
jgi:hypothetical protein